MTKRAAAVAGENIATPRNAFVVRPLTPARWADFETLFGPKGACAGCWCMWWRLRRSEWTRGKGAGNKRAMRAVVDTGEPPGLIAYAGKRPVGWIAIAPRQTYVALANSRVLKPVDDQLVWSITCFFVHKDFRRRGLTVQLLRSAIDFAAKRGARIVEGYPVQPKQAEMPAVFAFTGLVSAYKKAGFVEVARRSPTRPIMRVVL